MSFKNKKRFETSLLASFSASFLKKNISYVLYYQLTISCLPLLPEILGNMCIAIVCQRGYDVVNFKINLIFLIKLFFLYEQKVKIKIQIS